MNFLKVLTAVGCAIMLAALSDGAFAAEIFSADFNDGNLSGWNIVNSSSYPAYVGISNYSKEGANGLWFSTLFNTENLAYAESPEINFSSCAAISLGIFLPMWDIVKIYKTF